ncbi:uncharacterized protein LOC120359869 isoform X2 [Solenopsis invicta]|uniref:uncharacterized protein LOC120359869 isoform X2 n=1 Tax=Solenopsis invicta TaxID=13686 RepID=UPI00193D451C|nr:uncharacterized protein LOC120359869 isoform X2 [Solenopsis invicta]
MRIKKRTRVEAARSHGVLFRCAVTTLRGTGAIINLNIVKYSVTQTGLGDFASPESAMSSQRSRGYNAPLVRIKQPAVPCRGRFACPIKDLC